MRHGGDRYRNQIKLDFSVNTNPFGMPDAVKGALYCAIEQASFYPDDRQQRLKELLKKAYHIDSANVICTNGASELFQAIVRALTPEKALVVDPGFGGYVRSLDAVGCSCKHHILSEENQFALTDAILSDLDWSIDLCYLACPNNPTGQAINPKLFLQIMEKAQKNNTYVILDMCFYDLMPDEIRMRWEDSDCSIAQLIHRFDHLIIVNAFTKSMALAGVRIGFGFLKNQKFCEQIEMQLPEWNVSVFAQNAGEASADLLLSNSNQLQQQTEKIRFLRMDLAEKLSKIGFDVYPSDVNFLLVKGPSSFNCDKCNQHLINHNRIMIRTSDSFIGLNHQFFRVAVKTEEENNRLVNALRAYLSNTVIDDKKIEVHSDLQFVRPTEIEGQSMHIIENELAMRGIVLPDIYAPIIKRCIHTTADFEYAHTLTFSKDAYENACRLIREGADIVTDTRMAFSGINKNELAKYGGEVHCFMADEDVAKEAKARGVTRATVSMEKAAKLNRPVIFAIGNAPTALVELHKLYEDGYQPAFIIGVPVGFVNVVASKEMIMQTDIPYIVNRGRKGGSNVAAAICNAILYSMRE